MRSRTYLPLCWLVYTAPAFLCAGNAGELGVPKLAYVSDPASHTVRLISGIPGAAVVGSPAALPVPAAGLFIPPSTDWLIALLPDSRIPAVIRLAAPGDVSAVEGASATDTVVFSPAGASAALLNRDAARIEVLSGLPANPRIARIIDIRPWNQSPTFIAISDDAGLVLLALPGTGLLSLSNSSSQVIPLEDDPTAIAFAPGRHDAVVVAGSQVFLLRNSELQLAGTHPDTVGAALSAGGRLLLADARGTVVSIDTAAGSVTTVDCRCKATGLHPLSDNGLFRLNEFDGGPAFLLDTRAAVPRVWFVPVDRGNQ